MSWADHLRNCRLAGLPPLGEQCPDCRGAGHTKATLMQSRSALRLLAEQFPDEPIGGSIAKEECRRCQSTGMLAGPGTVCGARVTHAATMCPGAAAKRRGERALAAAIYGTRRASMTNGFTYQFPIKARLALSLRLRAKAFPEVVWAACLVVVTAMVSGFFTELHADELARMAGFPGRTEVPLLVLLLFVAAGVLAVRALNARRIFERVDAGEAIRFSMDEGGLRFATDSLDSYVKWKGIAQLLPDREGWAISHGGTFFLVPAGAFADAADQRAFAREVYRRLGEEARARSEKYVRAALEA
jgi:hypothetical protein